MSKKLTTKEFVKKAKIVHNNKYNYDKVNYKGISTKVIVNCPEDGDFLQIPSNHLQGNGCPRCAIKIRSLNKKLTAEEFIRKSKKIHKNKYDYRRVVYIDSYTKVIIICPEHGKFLQRPNAHLMGRGCSICSKNKILTTEEFIIRAKKIHNDKYNYNKVNYKNYDTKVIITCPIHGDFLQIPDVHLHKHGCPKCMAVTNSLKQRHTVEQFVEAAKKVHGNKYDYSKVKYINNHTKIIVTCPKHGKFLQLPNNHLKNRGCKNCQKSKGELEVAKTLDKKNINYTVNLISKVLKEVFS